MNNSHPRELVSPPRPSILRGRLARRRGRAKDWDAHVGDLERMASRPAFLALRDQVLEQARLRAGDRLLDIGSGTGLLALAAAPRVAHVRALDVSPAMCSHLAQKFERLGVDNAEVLVNTATELPIPDDSVDVVVSNYCFHHLSDHEKRRALDQIRRVLRPGGRLVFADMMFRFGVGRARDRAVIALFAARMLRMGPGGLLRLLKNGARLLAGRGEHPADVEWWREMLQHAGFIDVAVQALEHEGGIARARVPA
jgi:ubiquinone/menaquinone biosynthesis C-methylase UbiE